MKYKVTIKEVLALDMEVEADDAQEAEELVESWWDRQIVVLTAQNFDSVEFTAEEVKE